MFEQNTLYQADNSSETLTRKFITILKMQFKTRYENINFNYQQHKSDTKLSRKPWKIEASKEKPIIEYQEYNVNIKRCRPGG